MEKSENPSIEEMAEFVKKYLPIYKRLEKQLELYKKCLIEHLNKGEKIEGIKLRKYRKEYHKFRKETTIFDIALLFPEISEEHYSKKVLMDFKELPDFMREKLENETLLVEKKEAVFGVVLDK